MFKRSNKKSRSIFTKLVVSYVIFSLSVVCIFIVCLLSIAFTAGGGNVNTLYPYNVEDENGNPTNIKGILNMNGWVEELDNQYNVVNTYGDKKTDTFSYNDDELFKLTSLNDAKRKGYIGFIDEKASGEGYYLVIYHRADIDVKITLLISNTGTNTLWNIIFVSGFFILFAGLCLVMGYYLSRRIRKPLKEITSGMERVQNGEAGVRIDFKAEAEFAQIRDSFNMMISSLERAKKEKEENEQKKERMLLELSHDIRTPIATINSYSVALEQGLVKAEDLEKYYDTIRKKAERVTNMADDMFTMLKMDSSEYVIHKTKMDICEFIRRQCAEYYVSEEEGGLEIIPEIPDKAILYEADYILMERVIGNLLTNAIKYNKSGKYIFVSVSENESVIEIEIADDGAPIDNEIAERLFEAFVRGDKARKTTGGTGLGLAITHAIVKKHGGNIKYEYRDKKNCFIIEFNK